MLASSQRAWHDLQSTDPELDRPLLASDKTLRILLHVPRRNQSATET